MHVEAYTYHTALGGNPEIHECVCGAYHHEADVFAAFAEAGQYHPPKNTDPRLAKTLRTIINNAASALAAAQAQDMFRRLVEAVGPDYEDVDGYLRVLRGYASVGNGGEQAIRMVARQASGRILVFVMGVAVREERVEQESGGDAFWDLL